MNLSSKRQSLLPQKRWQHRLLDAALILAAILGARYWQTRGLPEGVTPQLVGVLADDSPAKVGVGDTATLVTFWAEAFPA